MNIEKVSSQEIIRIPFNKAKIKKIVIACIVLLGLSIWGLIIADNQTSFKPSTLKLYSYGGVVFCGLFLFYEVYTLFFDKRAGLEINAKGITDNTSALGSKSINWTEITHFKKTKAFGAEYITVYTSAQYKMKNGNVFQYIGRASVNNEFGTTFMISSGLLDCDLDELLKVLTERLGKYGK
jgi:hypothetical protein